jgi:hypothetical protein
MRGRGRVPGGIHRDEGRPATAGLVREGNGSGSEDLGVRHIGQQLIAARLASLVCPTYSAPPSHRLRCKRVRRQGLTLRVTLRFFRGHDAEANASFCHARVVYSVGQERRATRNENVGRNALRSSTSASSIPLARQHFVRGMASVSHERLALTAFITDVSRTTSDPKGGPSR